MNWKGFQTNVKKLFEFMDCVAHEDYTVQGARAKHKIDVFVEFDTFGYKSFWVVECKFWNSNITKEKVLALKSVVEDIGADKGVIISRKWFQSGAILASKNTNLILTDYDDLRAYLYEEMAGAGLNKLLRRIAILQTRIFDKTLGKAKPPYEDLGSVTILEMQVKDAISGRWPIVVPTASKDNTIILKDTNSLCNYGDQILVSLEAEYRIS